MGGFWSSVLDFFVFKKSEVDKGQAESDQLVEETVRQIHETERELLGARRKLESTKRGIAAKLRKDKRKMLVSEVSKVRSLAANVKSLEQRLNELEIDQQRWLGAKNQFTRMGNSNTRVKGQQKIAKRLMRANRGGKVENVMHLGTLAADLTESVNQTNATVNEAMQAFDGVVDVTSGMDEFDDALVDEVVDINRMANTEDFDDLISNRGVGTPYDEDSRNFRTASLYDPRTDRELSYVSVQSEVKEDYDALV